MLLAVSQAAATISASTAGGRIRATGSTRRRGWRGIRMYWEGPQLYRPNERPFALHRNGYAGMQRYGAFLWSGDVYSTWETLKTHVPVAVNTGLSGIPFWGTDIGGFVPTPEYTGELHVRWFQFGTFCPLVPLARPQLASAAAVGLEHRRARPDGAARLHRRRGGSGSQRAAQRRTSSRSAEVPRAALPAAAVHLHAGARVHATRGLPMMRALWLHYPDDPAAVARGDQFLWGRDLLVSPVVEKGATARRLYLPEGRVVRLLDRGARRRRPRDRARGRSRDDAAARARRRDHPAWVRCSSTSTSRSTGRSAIVVYPGADGAFVAVRRRWRTFDYRKGAFMRIAMAWDDRARRLSLRLAPGSRMLPPMARPMRVRVAGSKEEKSVTFDGRPLAVTLSPSA